ncbi:alternative ribosome rescue aminoacyl-tRNA hydrolase ArfB [Desertihabitans aurantiacus]|uniref:alternative ribosome rescue aminoacyl-tRNA hydrolase ArfB n=1 Tax=Desertihabitans aurantiacus TaxID=2282477 RepID=UPI000DF7BCE8|nr:alternative ribosome rescue aminoacyl-tRNA hydrolase ArfB [Desertihabitans aurantiacus]
MSGTLALVVPPGPGLPDGLVVPGEELVERFSRASGPGGQGVNTTDSRVELVFDATASSVLPPRAAQRLGVVRVVATEQRSQRQNRAAARDRLAERIREACAPPPPKRVPTKPSKASRRRRLEAKVRRGRTKALRGRVQPD